MNLDKIKKDRNKTELKEEDEPVEDSQFSFLFSLSGGFYWSLRFFSTESNNIFQYFF